MGNGLRIICKKEKQEWYCPQAYHSRFLAIPSAFVLLPGFSDSIPDVGGGQSPQKAINTMSYLLCKKTQKMYKIFSHGYTVNRRYLRQQQNHKFDSKILHIYFLSGRFIFQRHKNFYSLDKNARIFICGLLLYAVITVTLISTINRLQVNPRIYNLEATSYCLVYVFRL